MDSFFDLLKNTPEAGRFLVFALSFFVIFMGIIYLIAFLQGRAISFWPLKIGEKPSKNPLNKNTSISMTNVTKLNNPREVIESAIQGLQSVEAKKIVVWRVMPLEFTTAIFSSFSELARQYEEIMSEIIHKGENDIGFFDATIYGCTHDKKVNFQTATFIRKNYLPFSDTSSIGINTSINHFGLFIIGESETGVNIQWKQGMLYFSSTTPRRLPVSGIVIKDHNIIENSLKNWWAVLQKECQDNNKYWSSTTFASKPEDWKKVIEQVAESLDPKTRKQN